MATRIYVNDENNPVSSIEELENKYDKKYLSEKFFYCKCEKCGKILQKKYYLYTGKNYGVPPNNCVCRECKYEKTMVKKYGSMRYLIDKSRKSMMKKYGSTSTAQFIDYTKTDYAARTEKSRKTCIAKYGVDNPAKAQVVKDKIKETNLERYGETHACKLPEMRKKLSEIAKARPEFKSAAISHETHLANRLAEVKEKQLEWLDSDKFRGRYNKQTGKINYYSFKCKKCGLEFEDSFSTTIYDYSTPYCRACNPPLARSLKEKEVTDSIKSYYSGTILENGRKALKGKHTELDVYLPDLKLAVEFNGTFWHGYTRCSYEAGVDLEEYGLAMLKAGASTKDKKAEELITLDAKEFILGDDKLIVAQINTVDEKEVTERKEELANAINSEISEKSLSAFVFVITNILTSNSEVLVLGAKQDKVAAAFGKTLANDFMTLEGVVSRKKQVVPQITEEFTK